ncbi:M96 mating-specific protein family [Phytophthora cinnamomi]|uniref:M96 mating-specific protein family n=1 Tax=Phytophthora cinnamomi TaxID=4785 RepID=UPI00355A0AF8|nr:M96 mating-specific protein family [Phytophthora cinnamomi]
MATRGALWPALNDEELAASSSSSSSSSATPQRVLLPSTSHAQLSELSAFLAASAATSAAPQTLLDDLLRDESHEDVMGDAAFFSLHDEAQRGVVTHPAPSSSSRLLQLESNYERKKKRAKINRKDLNSRFQELMDILHLKEDRKLNRAKILEKTIEHIEKLTAELNALKGGHQHTAGKTPLLQQRQLHTMAGHHSRASSAAQGGAPLLPYTPSQWSAAGVGAGGVSLAPMMWVPCPVVTSSGMMLKRAAPVRPADTASRKRGRVESMESTVTTSSEAESGAEGTDLVAVETAVAAKETSLFVWSAQEIPTFLAFCDAWTLVTVMRTSRELRSAARGEKLWEELCRERWRISPEISIAQPRQQWQQWHQANLIPTDVTEITSGGIQFASGRANNISVWASLSHRSNGHTTRTVLLNGKATVMQVVELFIIVQNLSRARVRLTDCISLASKSSTGKNNAPFEPFTAASGAHLTPQIVALNADHCATKDLSAVALHHGDICVLSVFMACPGLDLEDQFLQRAGSLNIQFEMDTLGSDVKELVNVRAACKDHNDYDRSREKAMVGLRHDTK